MAIRLPFRRVCSRHLAPVYSDETGERETIKCEDGHNCNGWLIVDAEDNWVGVGHRERDGEIFTIPRPLPMKVKEKKKLPIPHRPCLYGHMNWTEFVDQFGKTRYRCKTCQTQTFRRLKKKGLVKKVVR
jgi:hypothetical protein